MRIDLKEAERHIETVTGWPDTSVSWQLFDDLKSRKDRRLARSFHGRLPDVAGRLQKAQEAGCGVFFAVNETDGTGRKIANMRHARALFLDLDGAPLPSTWPIEPSLIAHSSAHGGTDKFQVWWALEPTDDWQTWRKVAMGLVRRYGGDPKCTITTQVGRCAGFLHLKDPAAPWLVRIVHIGPGIRHTLADIVTAFAIDLDAITLPPPRPAAHDRPAPAHGWDDPFDVAAAHLLVADEDAWATTSNGAVSIFKMACRLRDLGISEGLAADLIEQHAPALPPEAEGNPHFVPHKVANTYRYAAGEAGSRSAETDKADLLAALETMEADHGQD